MDRSNLSPTSSDPWPSEMLRRAGLTNDIIRLGIEDEHFREVLETMLTIHTGKQVLYGDYQEKHGDEPRLFSLMLIYSDIKRKFTRIENYMLAAAAGKTTIPVEELLDTYMDIAVYGAMGVELIQNMLEKERGKGTPAVSHTGVSQSR